MKNTERIDMISPKTYAQVKKVLVGMAKEAYSTGLKGIEEKEPVKPGVKWNKPDFHYSYTQPETFSLGSFLKWFKAANRYYRVALEYEAQEQNKQFSCVIQLFCFNILLNILLFF